MFRATLNCRSLPATGGDSLRGWTDGHGANIPAISSDFEGAPGAFLVGGFSPYPSEKSWSENQLG